jgi:hypothetical protein
MRALALLGTQHQSHTPMFMPQESHALVHDPLM